jgi:hypothetical protein
MQTRSSRRQLTVRGLMLSTRGSSTPGPFSPHADSLSRSTTIRETGGLALASCREAGGAAESWCGQVEDLLSTLPGSYPTAESELENIARSISRSAVAANLAAIATQRKQTLDMASARKELSPLPPPKTKVSGRRDDIRDDILSLLLDGMLNIFAEPAAGTWLEQHVNLLYVEVFALLKDSELMVASEVVYHKTMALLCIYQERVEAKLLASGASLSGHGSSRRRFDRYAFDNLGPEERRVVRISDFSLDVLLFLHGSGQRRGRGHGRRPGYVAFGLSLTVLLI